MMKVVTVFGGSAVRSGDQGYAQAERLGAALARAGYAVATGGYEGAMEAASKGAAEAGGRVIGYSCEALARWHGLKPNRWVQEVIPSQTLHERVVRLIDAGEALLALPGGVGTLSEVALSWSLMQTREIAPKPLVLIGDGWQATLSTFLETAGTYIRSADADLLAFAEDTDQAVKLVRSRLDGKHA